MINKNPNQSYYDLDRALSDIRDLRERLPLQKYRGLGLMISYSERGHLILTLNLVTFDYEIIRFIKDTTSHKTDNVQIHISKLIKQVESYVKRMNSPDKFRIRRA